MLFNPIFRHSNYLYSKTGNMKDGVHPYYITFQQYQHTPPFDTHFQTQNDPQKKSFPFSPHSQFVVSRGVCLLVLLVNVDLPFL